MVVLCELLVGRRRESLRVGRGRVWARRRLRVRVLLLELVLLVEGGCSMATRQ